MSISCFNDFYELAMVLVGLDPDSDYDELETQEEVSDLLFEKYGIDDDDQFIELINDLMPLIDIGKSPITNTTYKGFSRGNSWLSKTEVPNASSPRNTRQREILQWACATFGTETADNTEERIRRFAEEAIELAQASGLDQQAMFNLVDHVYYRPAGDTAKEIGQVGIALLGLAEHLKISAEFEEKKEFERITSLSPQYWQARQNAKADKGIALPATPEESCRSFS